MRRNRTLRLSVEELALHDEARGHLDWSVWARRALRECAEDQKVTEARLAAEREKREKMRDTMIGGWM